MSYSTDCEGHETAQRSPQIERRRVALIDDADTANKLASARKESEEKARSGKRRLKLSAAVERANPHTARRASERGTQHNTASILRQLAESTEQEDVKTAGPEPQEELMKQQEAALMEEEEATRKDLPGYIEKLILGYELRVYWFEPYFDTMSCYVR